MTTVNDITAQSKSKAIFEHEHSQTELTQDMIDKLTLTDALPQPYPAPILSATFKHSPEDFRVDELMDIELSGEGEHLWLHIQKTGMNTVYVVDQLARWANIPKRDVGYSGMKDRQAVTTQWFSLRIPKKQLPATDFKDYLYDNGSNSYDSNSETLSVLSQKWHGKKLNRGTHRGNRFIITLRDVVIDDSVVTARQDIDKTLTLVKAQGIPNYFGAQRFGRQGNNITQALEWLENNTINGRKPHPKKSRDLQSILLSAARSAIFNHIVAQRVRQDTWNTAMAGDVFNLSGSGSVFTSQQIDDTIRARLASADIHPTAPLWGINNDKVQDEAKALEETIIKENPMLSRLADGLEKKGVKVMRRPTRLLIEALSWTWTDEHTLVLDFSLPSGAFATSVLSSIVKKLSF